MSIFGLAGLLNPLDTDTFLSQFWGKKAVLIPGGAEKFSSIFNWREVEDALNLCRQNYNGLRLVHDKQGLPPTAFTDLPGWLNKGATLVLNSVQETDPVLEKLQSALSLDMNTAININAYVSYPAKQGFDTHFDRHDVFILQTEGKKKWRVFNQTAPNTFPLHLQSTGCDTPPADMEPYLECEMSEGDVLYIPRGHWHDAISVTPCVHLTVGPKTRAPADFLTWLWPQIVNQDEFLRQDFPTTQARELGGNRDEPSLTDHIIEFKRHLSDLFSRDSMDEAIIRYFMISNPRRQTFQYPEVWTLNDILTRNTRLEFPTDQKAIIRYDPETQKAKIYIRGLDFALNGISADMLGFIFENPGQIFTATELMKQQTDVTWEKTKEYLLLLLQRGVIMVHRNEVAAATASS